MTKQIAHKVGTLSQSDLGTFVSLYSGCGGLDLGFAQAGFRPVWANDFDQHAVDTYNRIAEISDPAWTAAAAQFAGHAAICGDVREQVVRADVLADLFPTCGDDLYVGTRCLGGLLFVPYVWG